MSERSVLITGGARPGRFGEFLTRHLAANDWQVVIHCNRSIAAGEKLVAEIRNGGGQAALVQQDLAELDSCPSLVAKAADLAGGPLWALINNAAIFEYDNSASVSPAALDAHWRINLAAPILLSSAFAQQAAIGMQASIVQILDQRIVNPNADFISYTASKMGLSGIVAPLALAFAGRCRVNALAPGALFPSHNQTDIEFAAMADDNLAASAIDLHQVAGAVDFLLNNSAINGETLFAANGQQLVGKARDPIVAP